MRVFVVVGVVALFFVCVSRYDYACLLSALGLATLFTIRINEDEGACKLVQSFGHRSHPSTKR